MFSLRLFGGATIEAFGAAPLPHRVRQRHRLALLALLALHERGLSRDKLIAYLWPESDAKRGRNLLNVSAYVLRDSLGEGAIVSRGDEMCLDFELIRPDVAAFEGALERGECEAAVRLYDGPFLDGFFLSDALEFERWVDGERERLAAAYGRALEALAESAGDTRAAVEWWRKRAAHDRYDSRVTLRLMEALEAAGNPAGALEVAAIHESLLRDDFGTRPIPEIARAADRLRRQPAAASSAPAGAESGDPPAPRPTSEDPAATGTAAPVAPAVGRPAVTAPDETPAVVAPVVAARRRRRTRRPHSAIVPGLVVATLIAAGWAVWPESPAPPGRIAVLPFTNLSPGDDYFSDGVTEEIITRLASVPGLKVISRTSVMRFKGSDTPIRRIAEELDVAHMLEGSVRLVDGRVRITAQLVDADADHHLWVASYDRELGDVFEVQEEIARDVVQALEVELAEPRRELLSRRGTSDPEAFRLYLRGRYLWTQRTREGHDRARRYFERAIERDSAYADAYAGLAYTYLAGYQLGFASTPEAEVYSRIKWAAERALALDESSADAHVSLAIVLWWQRDWPGAERELRRAIELSPGHSTAHGWLALLLGGWGRLDEALEESRAAYDLDPFAIIVSNIHGTQLYNNRRYEAAAEQFHRTHELGTQLGYSLLARTLALDGRHEEALAAARRDLAKDPEQRLAQAALAWVLASAGRRPEAVKALELAKAEQGEPFDVALAHVALAEPDSAFEWLRVSSWQWPHRANRFDPALDPLRSDPRFAELSEGIEREMGIR